MQRRAERVPLAERLEDPDRFWAPEIDRQMRRELVSEKDRAVGRGLLQVIEGLDPTSDEHASGSDRQEVEKRGQGRRLARMGLLRRDEDRTVRLEDHPAECRGARIHVPCLEKLGDRHRDRRLSPPAPPTPPPFRFARGPPPPPPAPPPGVPPPPPPPPTPAT